MNRSLIGVVCATFLAASVIWSGEPASSAPPTFTKDVAPILYKNCASCHRKGEIAPMSLLTYEQARPWAKSIREKGAIPSFLNYRGYPATVCTSINEEIVHAIPGSRRLK